MTPDGSILSALRSDMEIGSILGIEIDGYRGLTRLDATALDPMSKNADASAHIAEMITAVRGGKHMTLQVSAITFRQRPSPNRRFLRLADDKLADRAGSWKGLPFLVDHTTYRMDAAKGTILSSKYVQESAKVGAFEQSLHVVKPDAVIGFLDGTYKKFSIGWFALGPVMCSVHGCDVSAADSCYCWPGETVMIDGKPKVVEYGFTDYEGKEVSAVVVPAVRDTDVSEIRAALAAELHLPPRTRPPKERSPMAFAKLAAALALAALSEGDEDGAVRAVTGLRERASAAELDATQLRAEVTRLTGEVTSLRTLVSAAQGAVLDGHIAEAYKSGRLAHGKDAEGKNTPDAMESLLREYGASAGADKLAAKIAAKKVVVPVGQAPVSLGAGQPPRTEHKNEDPSITPVPSDETIALQASQLGIPVNQLRARWGKPPLAALQGGSQ
jgi:hypothetical protein